MSNRPSSPTRLFISYSRKDSPFVHQLVSDLDRAGFQVWLDKSDIQSGDSWRKSIVDAIADCGGFLLVMSPNSVSSVNVTKEVSLAESRQKRIFPIIYQPCEIPADLQYQLVGIQYTDFPALGYTNALARLLAALRGTPPPRIEPPPPPPQQTTGFPQPLQQQPMPPPTQAQFNLVGTWQVQIAHPLTGMVLGAGQFIFYANGQFQGAITTMTDSMQASGQWQAAGLQIALQGGHVLASMPWQTLPYALMLQVTNIAGNTIYGVSTAGEQVIFQRIA